jgi:short-subunit dehydrogenase
MANKAKSRSLSKSRADGKLANRSPSARAAVSAPRFQDPWIRFPTFMPAHEGLYLILRLVADVGLLLLFCVVYPLHVLRRWFGTHSPKQFRSVFITGASVGLGAGLALELAEPGVALFLTARSAGALQQTASQCRAKGAQVKEYVVDVKSASQMRAAVEDAYALRVLDLVIANAGITGELGLADAPDVVHTNMQGTLSTVLPVIELWIRHGNGGSLAIMSSLNGHVSVGNTFMAAYASSKAGLRVLAESLRMALVEHGIQVTALLPGMTESRMVSRQQDQGIHMITGVWPRTKACAYMVRGIRAQAAEVAYPQVWFSITRLVGGLPLWVRDLFHVAFRRGDPYTAHAKNIDRGLLG